MLGTEISVSWKCMYMSTGSINFVRQFKYMHSIKSVNNIEFNYSNLIKWLYDKIVLFIIGLCFEYVYGKIWTSEHVVYKRSELNNV